MSRLNQKQIEPRRGTAPAEEDYLARIGERLRIMRARQGMSRKVLSLASGVSERYLAEMERGSGNASLLVIRRLASALGIKVSELAAEEDRSADPEQTMHYLEGVAPADTTEAHDVSARRFDSGAPQRNDRIALIGMRGAGKSALGCELAGSLGVPFIELDREVERATGMDLAEILAAHGQAGFRRFEFGCLQDTLASYPRCVIVTGGGIVTEPETFELLLKRCFVVWLRASPEQHLRRVAGPAGSRSSVAHRRAIDDLLALAAVRSPLYGKADATIDTSAMTEAEALAQIKALIAVRG